MDSNVSSKISKSTPRRPHKNQRTKMSGATPSYHHHRFFSVVLFLLLQLQETAGKWGFHSGGGDHDDKNNNNDDNNGGNEGSRSEWYTKYDHYPSYCSTPEEMATRSIPPLPTPSKAGDSRLLQVTAVIRHGARTPWMPPTENSTCWPDYHQVWNCNLTTWLGTPPQRINDDVDSTGMFTINKVYNALVHENEPMYILRNEWSGTCQQGQLLMQGYDQELQNGQAFRDAYVYQGDGDYGHDARMRLLNAKSLLKGKNIADNLYYRSDDDQRTLMSGQIVLRGLLQSELNAYFAAKKQHPLLNLHVADRARDILDANEAICPRLGEISQRYQRSTDYQAFIQSKEYATLQNFKQNVLQGGLADLDCLMTTMCTDRDLPSQVNDYNGTEIGQNVDDYYKNNVATGQDGQQEPQQNSTDNDNTNNIDYGSNLFERLALQDAMRYNLLYTADNNQYSKQAMIPLWKEMWYHIKSATLDPPEDTDAVGDNGQAADDNENNNNGTDTKDDAASTTATTIPNPAKFALFSGHDTTILPLLASLGVWTSQDFWPPYASSVLLETHEINFDGKTDTSVYPNTNFAFRLIYNGEVWTKRIPGCPDDEDLCSFHVLEELLSFATEHEKWDCSLKYPEAHKYNDPVSQAQEILKKEGGSLAVGMIALVSFIVGMLFTVTVICCCCSEKGRLRVAKAVAAQRGRGHLVSTTSDYRDEQDGIMMSDQSNNGSSGHNDGDTRYHDDANEDGDGIL